MRCTNFLVSIPDARILIPVFGPQGLTRHIHQVLQALILRRFNHDRPPHTGQ